MRTLTTTLSILVSLALIPQAALAGGRPSTAQPATTPDRAPPAAALAPADAAPSASARSAPRRRPTKRAAVRTPSPEPAMAIADEPIVDEPAYAPPRPAPVPYVPSPRPPAATATVAAVPSRATHTGLTFEANLGLGVLRVDGGGETASERGLAGIDLGVGAFVSARTALTIRAAGVVWSGDGAEVTAAFLGPSLQQWMGSHVWIGGGAGLGLARATFADGEEVSATGLGLDLRAGYTFNPDRKHSLNVSVEVSPVLLDGGALTGIGFLIGYQTL